MEKGFIKLSRSFFNNKMWQAARKFSECEAWLDLIQSARFEASPTTSLIGSCEVTWNRGQYPASIRFLSKKWGQSESWVRKCLSNFKKEGMITIDNTQGVSVITLVNFDKYNTPSDTPSDTHFNTPNILNNNQLEQLITQVATQVVTQAMKSQHTSDTNNKKEEEYNNNYSLRSSNELLCGTSPHEEQIDYDKLADYFNSETKGVFGTIRKPLSNVRKGMIRARIKERGKEVFIEMIHKAYESDFLKGQNKNGWKASFDWLIKPTNFEKVISGNYDNRSKKDCGTDTADDDEDLMRHVAAGIARGYYEKQRRANGGEPVSGQ